MKRKKDRDILSTLVYIAVAILLLAFWAGLAYGVSLLVS